MINSTTEFIAHIGFPTHSFKSPMIYNPYLESVGVNVVVLPMACQAQNFAVFLRAVFCLDNTRGALITMPHKVSVVGLLDEVSAAVRVAGACNAVRRDVRGRLVGDMFDGEGFVRGLKRKGFEARGQRALVVGAGGVGCAIAASLAEAGVAAIQIFDINLGSAQALAQRLKDNYTGMEVQVGSNDPDGFGLVINATPLGMNEGDALPLDASRLSADAFVGEVVMKAQITPLVAAAQARGCRTLLGTDMLFEQIPAYLEFFGLPTTDAAGLRAVAQLGA